MIKIFKRRKNALVRCNIFLDSGKITASKGINIEFNPSEKDFLFLDGHFWGVRCVFFLIDENLMDIHLHPPNSKEFKDEIGTGIFKLKNYFERNDWIIENYKDYDWE